MRNSFVFYRSFNEAMEELSENDQLVLYRAIVDYGLDSREPSFNSSYLRMAWKLIKPQLDANWKRYNNGCKGKEFGKRGGAPKGNKNATKTTPKQPQDNPKITPKQPLMIMIMIIIKKVLTYQRKTGFLCPQKLP